MRREYPGVSAGRGVDVEMEPSVALHRVAALGTLLQDTILGHTPGGSDLLQLGIEVPHQTPLTEYK